MAFPVIHDLQDMNKNKKKGFKKIFFTQFLPEK